MIIISVYASLTLPGHGHGKLRIPERRKERCRDYQLGDDYSSGLGSYFKDAFAKLGGSIVSEEQFQTNQTDFKAILTNIKAADPDIIFAPSSITTAP